MEVSMLRQNPFEGLISNLARRANVAFIQPPSQTTDADFRLGECRFTP